MSEIPEITGKTVSSVEEIRLNDGHDWCYKIRFTDGSLIEISSNGASYCSSYLDYVFYEKENDG